MSAPEKPLRILAIVNLPWDARLGAARVWIELAEQWRAAGHTVEKFSLSDAFREAPVKGVSFAIRRALFPYRAAAFLRRNQGRFDVVDALIGTLPFAKDELGFGGLLVARSVGLYRLYDRFEQTVAARYPQRPRGKWAGRVLYQFAHRRLMAQSERSVSEADLVNVPNGEEAECVRTIAPCVRVTIEPYGLTADRRIALAKVAAGAEARLAARRVCFIGMWGVRKGAYDWPRIIERVLAEVPDARFRFLGTMADADVVLADLPRPAREHIELISNYAPDELPHLLAECTVGAFPSYVEGFGLAILEQLAAGVPTVAYHVAGPRDILHDGLAELLVPAGAIDEFAACLCRLLRADVTEYERLAAHSQSIAARFSWPDIARSTIATYRATLRERGRPLLFAQPFSVRSTGGGARILRALLGQSPRRAVLVCTSPAPPPERDGAELHVARRPFFGRVEQSRLARLPELAAPVFRLPFRSRLRHLYGTCDPVGVHVIPHGSLDFYDAWRVAAESRRPVFLQVHDDFVYSAKAQLPIARANRVMREVWNDAQLCFVISPELGDEYCRRYGAREYIVVTDGIERLANVRALRNRAELKIYFMGLFHFSYEQNVRVLLQAMDEAARQRPGLRLTLTLRCGQLPAHDLQASGNLRVLPFGSETDVERDLADADLLYLPLPFAPEFEPFVKLSLSTKLVTYLGSGVPILYQGPREAAAHRVLAETQAAFLETSLDVDALARRLLGVVDEPEQSRAVAENALALAAAKFMLEQQRAKFWGAIEPFL